MEMILNLTPGFNPTNALEEECIDFKHFKFASGEHHIVIKDDFNEFSEPTDVNITTRINSMDDLGKLMVAVDALSQTGWLGNKWLTIPYFPGSRQDRRNQYGEPLTVKIYADIINDMEFDGVSIWDPHSDVTSALLENVSVINNHKFVDRCLTDMDPNDTTDYLIVSPDAGSLKKVNSLLKHFNFGSNRLLKCDKDRNPLTGKIESFEVHSPDLTGKTCVIVDDICSGGGTFIGLAKELKELGCHDIYLIVTHGEFGRDVSSTLNKLSDHFNKVYTSNSIRDYNKKWHEAIEHYNGTNYSNFLITKDYV